MSVGWWATKSAEKLVPWTVELSVAEKVPHWVVSTDWSSAAKTVCKTAESKDYHSAALMGATRVERKERKMVAQMVVLKGKH